MVRSNSQKSNCILLISILSTIASVSSVQDCFCPLRPTGFYSSFEGVRNIFKKAPEEVLIAMIEEFVVRFNSLKKAQVRVPKIKLPTLQFISMTKSIEKIKMPLTKDEKEEAIKLIDERDGNAPRSKRLNKVQAEVNLLNMNAGKRDLYTTDKTKLIFNLGEHMFYVYLFRLETFNGRWKMKFTNKEWALFGNGATAVIHEDKKNKANYLNDNDKHIFIDHIISHYVGTQIGYDVCVYFQIFVNKMLRYHFDAFKTNGNASTSPQRGISMLLTQSDTDKNCKSYSLEYASTESSIMAEIKPSDLKFLERGPDFKATANNHEKSMELVLQKVYTDIRQTLDIEFDVVKGMLAKKKEAQLAIIKGKQKVIREMYNPKPNAAVKNQEKNTLDSPNLDLNNQASKNKGTPSDIKNTREKAQFQNTKVTTSKINTSKPDQNLKANSNDPTRVQETAKLKKQGTTYKKGPDNTPSLNTKEKQSSIPREKNFAPKQTDGPGYSKANPTNGNIRNQPSEQTIGTKKNNLQPQNKQKEVPQKISTVGKGQTKKYPPTKAAVSNFKGVEFKNEPTIFDIDFNPARLKKNPNIATTEKTKTATKSIFHNNNDDKELQEFLELERLAKESTSLNGIKDVGAIDTDAFDNEIKSVANICQIADELAKYLFNDAQTTGAFPVEYKASDINDEEEDLLSGLIGDLPFDSFDLHKQLSNEPEAEHDLKYYLTRSLSSKDLNEPVEDETNDSNQSSLTLFPYISGIDENLARKKMEANEKQKASLNLDLPIHNQSMKPTIQLEKQSFKTPLTSQTNDDDLIDLEKLERDESVSLVPLNSRTDPGYTITDSKAHSQVIITDIDLNDGLKELIIRGGEIKKLMAIFHYLTQDKIYDLIERDDSEELIEQIKIKILDWMSLIKDQSYYSIKFEHDTPHEEILPDLENKVSVYEAGFASKLQQNFSNQLLAYLYPKKGQKKKQLIMPQIQKIDFSDKKGLPPASLDSNLIKDDRPTKLAIKRDPTILQLKKLTPHQPIIVDDKKNQLIGQQMLKKLNLDLLNKDIKTPIQLKLNVDNLKKPMLALPSTKIDLQKAIIDKKNPLLPPDKTSLVQLKPKASRLNKLVLGLPPTKMNLQKEILENKFELVAAKKLGMNALNTLDTIPNNGFSLQDQYKKLVARGQIKDTTVNQVIPQQNTGEADLGELIFKANVEALIAEDVINEDPEANRIQRASEPPVFDSEKDNELVLTAFDTDDIKNSPSKLDDLKVAQTARKFRFVKMLFYESFSLKPAEGTFQIFKDFTVRFSSPEFQDFLLRRIFAKSTYTTINLKKQELMINNVVIMRYSYIYLKNGKIIKMAWKELTQTPALNIESTLDYEDPNFKHNGMLSYNTSEYLDISFFDELDQVDPMVAGGKQIPNLRQLI